MRSVLGASLNFLRGRGSRAIVLAMGSSTNSAVKLRRTMTRFVRGGGSGICDKKSVPSVGRTEKGVVFLQEFGLAGGCSDSIRHTVKFGLAG